MTAIVNPEMNYAYRISSSCTVGGELKQIVRLYPCFPKVQEIFEKRGDGDRDGGMFRSTTQIIINILGDKNI